MKKLQLYTIYACIAIAGFATGIALKKHVPCTAHLGFKAYTLTCCPADSSVVQPDGDHDRTALRLEFTQPERPEL